MKVIEEPIEMVCWFDTAGVPHPIRFRYNGSVIKVGHITQTSEEGYNQDKRKIYRCQSEILGRVRVFELRYECRSCKWILWKM